MNKQLTGFSGEKYAAGLLVKHGYKVIDKNFRSKLGEIDIIALKENKLIFVEVKTRSSRKFGLPEEAVTQTKLQKIARTGDYYVLLHPNLPKIKRIDVVSLEVHNGNVISQKIIPVI